MHVIVIAKQHRTQHCTQKRWQRVPQRNAKVAISFEEEDDLPQRDKESKARRRDQRADSQPVSTKRQATGHAAYAEGEDKQPPPQKKRVAAAENHHNRYHTDERSRATAAVSQVGANRRYGNVDQVGMRRHVDGRDG